MTHPAPGTHFEAAWAATCVAHPSARVQVFVWYNSGMVWRTDYEQVADADGLTFESMASATDLEGAPRAACSACDRM
jgi:hypothetical protein